MASKAINRIRSEVTEFKLYCIEYITSHDTYKELLNSKSSGDKLKSFSDSCILKLYEKSQSKISNFINVNCQEDINQVMPYLLPDDVKAPVLRMSCEIAFRRAVDKITGWCDANLILLDIQKDIQNKLVHLSKGDSDIIEIDFCATSIRALQESISEIHLVPLDFKLNHVNMLSEVLSILKKEIGSTARKLIISLTIDLYIALLTYSPKNVDDIYNACFIDIWSLCPKSYDIESYFIGAQNIKFLILGEHFEISTEAFASMLSNLIEKGIFDADKLKSYLTKLNSLQWKDTKCLKIISCLCNILNINETTS